MMLRQQFLKAELSADMERGEAIEKIRPAIEANGFRFLGFDPNSLNAPAFAFKADDCALTLYVVNDRTRGSLYTFILDFKLGRLRSSLSGGLPVHRFPDQVVWRIVEQLRQRGVRARAYGLTEENWTDPV